MTTPVRQWLDYALLQSAAETYLDQADSFTNEVRIREILTTGNNHPDLIDLPANAAILPGKTRFTDVDAQWFTEHYEIVDHRANTSSGFSATLFRSKDTGEYTLSFRSTEFAFGAIDHAANPNLPDRGGDWARDGAPGADGEVSNDGFALGQLSDMEAYYQSLKSGEQPLLPTGSILNVTGYSLGAHLSTAFTLMHESEVNHTYNYNAAGIGGIRLAPGSNDYKSPNGQDIAALIDTYRQMMAWDGTGTPSGSWWNEMSEDAKTNFRAAATLSYGTTFASVYANPLHQQTMGFLSTKMVGAGLGDVLGGPFGIGTNRSIAGLSSLMQDPTNPNGWNSNIGDMGSWQTKITQLYGHGEFYDMEFVANSGYHATPQSIFIEDMPLSRSLGLLQLVNDEYRSFTGDFGESHSITPIVDSLSVLDMIQQMTSGFGMKDFISLEKTIANSTVTLDDENKWGQRRFLKNF